MTDIDHAKLAASIETVLAGLGEDPKREGLVKTPLRVAKSLDFLTSGYRKDPAQILRSAVFHEQTDEMVVVREAGATRLARIAYPGDGSVLALDPDIPPGRQRVSLQLSGPAGPGWRWQVDATTPMRADRPALWLPSPGSHSIRLVDATGLELDQVVVQVRALRGKRR